MPNYLQIVVLFFSLHWAAHAATGDNAVTDAVDKQNLGAARIFFQHMSVGNNTLTGLQRIPHDSLAIEEIKLGAGKFELAPSTLSHALFGQNGDPIAKIEQFEKTLNESFAGDPDVALMKLCYADFSPDTDANRTFERYAAAIEGLKKGHPHTVFVHVTTPLWIMETGVKAMVKSILGVKDGTARANMQRGKYNDLIRSRFANESVFDLAKIESTWPDGRAETFERNGKSWQSLVPQYSNDGGHLNEIGQERAAPALLDAIKEALRRKAP